MRLDETWAGHETGVGHETGGGDETGTKLHLCNSWDYKNVMNAAFLLNGLIKFVLAHIVWY